MSGVCVPRTALTIFFFVRASSTSYSKSNSNYSWLVATIMLFGRLLTVVTPQNVLYLNTVTVAYCFNLLIQTSSLKLGLVFTWLLT